MVNFQELQISQFHNFEMGILKFQNDDVTRKIQNARRNRRIATHEITKSKMSQNRRFLSTCSLSKEQSILSKGENSNAFFFLELCTFYDLTFLSSIKHPTAERWQTAGDALFLTHQYYEQRYLKY